MKTESVEMLFVISLFVIAILLLILTVLTFYSMYRKHQIRISLRKKKVSALLPLTLKDSDDALHEIENTLQRLAWLESLDSPREKEALYSSLYRHSRQLLGHKEQLLKTDHQYALLKTAITSQEKERERIGKTLHDEGGVVLTSIKMSLNSLIEAEGCTEQQRSVMEQNINRISGLIITIRKICEDLAAPSLRILGYYKTIENLALDLTSEKVSVITRFDYCPVLTNETALPLYRLTLEAINNILKHSGANRIFIVSVKSGNGILINIKYNAKGITNSDVAILSCTGKGSGLNNIESYAQIIGATVNYLMEDESNSKISIQIPQ